MTQVNSNTVRREESSGEKEGSDLADNNLQSKSSEGELPTYQGQILWIS